jgi:glutathione S-transferase
VPLAQVPGAVAVFEAAVAVVSADGCRSWRRCGARPGAFCPEAGNARQQRVPVPAGGPMQLIYTPRSHFSRKVRILLAALGLEAELVDAGNVAGSEPAAFGPNPLLKVPTLIDEGRVVFDSDHIAAYLVRTHDPADRYRVLTDDVETANARAVLNGIMALEVELILAARTGLDTDHARFAKMRASIERGLGWLEAGSGVFDGDPSYLGFHLAALWDHVALYRLVDLDYPRLRSRVDAYSALPFVAASRPL